MLIGLVGVPNSGKSTFFRAATLTDAEVANYPFTTIKPNQAVGYVTAECPCRKLGVKCNPNNSKCENGVRMIPVKMLDVAGLVPGASEGKGMGNQFMGDLITASGLIHVLDSSGKTNAEGKQEDWDPTKTIEILEYEIDEWLRGIASRAYQKHEKTAKASKTPIERIMGEQLSGLGITEDDVKEAMKKSSPDEHAFATELRRVSKPILVAANKSDLPESQENMEKLKSKGAIPCSADSELALREAERHDMIRYVPGSGGFEINGELNEKQTEALQSIKENVLDRYGSTGIQAIINRLVFEKLGYIVVYPVANMNKKSDKKGNVLPDAFLVKKGTNLKELAGIIHTSIAEGFIGGLDTEGRKIGAEHELKDGEIVEILFK
jgi:ribosome-binding ATPase YchF (GTP1/OBG family)